MKHVKLFNQLNEAVSRKHPVYKKLEKFLAKFPNDAKSWAQATEEIRDMAREAREIYTETDFDMTFDEWETNPKAPQPLDFRAIKTPSEWNTKGKEYILNTLDKMSNEAKDRFAKRFSGWIGESKIQMFEEFDEEVESKEEPYWEIELKNGKILVVDVEGGKGMADEPMEMVFLKVDGKIVHFKDIKDQIKDPEQAQELSNYLDDVSAGNDASARSFTE